MALPSSGPISMSMVATEFSSSQTTNMSLKGFGGELGTPVTSDIFLANSFYGQSALTSFTYSGTTPFEDSEGACEGILGATAYHSGGSQYPSSGDSVYEDSSGTTALSDGYYRQGNGDWFEVKNGEVVAGGRCGRSDRRLKRNIVFRTYSKSGIPIYEFEYINKSDGEGRYVGTMAQDLIKLGKSEAVITGKEGFYLVDYNKVDVDFYKI